MSICGYDAVNLRKEESKPMERDYSFLDTMIRGGHFDKKAYDHVPPRTYKEVCADLPRPLAAGRPDWEEIYDYAVKVLFTNIHRPEDGSGFVSNFVDAAFNDDIFMWDTVFMTFFCNLLHPFVPGICSLDNFYCKQMDDGEIPREMVRKTGTDFKLWVNAFNSPLYSYFHNHYGFRRLKELTDLPYEEMYKPDLGRRVEKNPYLTLDNLNHPLLALAEWESYCHTRDSGRLKLVLEPLYHYYRALRYHLRHQNGLYVTDWASMDNSPRNKYLGLAVDTSCEMALFARNLCDIMKELKCLGNQAEGFDSRIRELEEDYRQLAQNINDSMWNGEDGFYYDVTFAGRQTGIKTIAGFFPLIAGIADEEQAGRLSMWLDDQDTFNRRHRIPVLAADEDGYQPRGGYWSGSVWAPTNALVVRGLEQNGFHSQAKDIALNHLEALSRVYQDTGTIWENYPADELTSGDSDNRDFVGWSGLAPILYLIEYGIGLSLSRDTKDITLRWEISDDLVARGRLGCRNYWFAGKTADLEAVPAAGRLKITICTREEFSLQVIYRGGVHEIAVKGNLEVEI